MKESNLFSFSNERGSVRIRSKTGKLDSSLSTYKNMDKAFIEKSAEDFEKSLLSGELYLELRSKVTKRTNLTFL